MLLGLLLPELVMRWLLFSPSELAGSLGSELRHAYHFADPALEDEYWHLEWELETSDKKFKSAPFDPILGWKSGRFDAETWRHLLPDELPGRRQVLLYGASYAECVTDSKDCFQGLMRGADIAREFNLVNYGVGGYGIDQMYLLMKGSLDLYAAENPVVVIGLVVDTDLERCVLAFRSWPKPRLTWADGRLQDPEPVFSGGSAAYIADRGIGIRSYVWRYLLYGKTQLRGEWRQRLRGTGSDREEQKELIDAILLAIQEDLEGRGLDYFFLLFTSPRGLPPAEVPSLEKHVVSLFQERGTPFVHARPYILDAIASGEGTMETLFIQEGRGENHPTPAGNVVLFRAMLDGIQGRYAKDVEFE